MLFTPLLKLESSLWGFALTLSAQLLQWRFSCISLYMCMSIRHVGCLCICLFMNVALIGDSHICVNPCGEDTQLRMSPAMFSKWCDMITLHRPSISKQSSLALLLFTIAEVRSRFSWIHGAWWVFHLLVQFCAKLDKNTIPNKVQYFLKNIHSSGYWGAGGLIPNPQSTCWSVLERDTAPQIDPDAIMPLCHGVWV